jgi:hypothetical protein
MDYFSQFGIITDITIPQPFRSFAFITFQESSDAISILDQDHLIKGISVVTRSADPIHDQNKNRSQYNAPNQVAHEGPYQNKSGYAMPTGPVESPKTPNPEIMHQVNQALNHIINASNSSMVGYGRRPFHQEDQFRGTYATRVSPTDSPSGSPFTAYPNTFRGSAGSAGTNNGASSASQSIRNNIAPRRSSLIKADTTTSPSSTGWPHTTGNSMSPWDNPTDPQSKIYSHGKSWL